MLLCRFVPSRKECRESSTDSPQFSACWPVHSLYLGMPAKLQKLAIQRRLLRVYCVFGDGAGRSTVIRTAHDQAQTTSQRSPSLQKIVSIAKELDVPLYDLFYFEKDWDDPKAVGRRLESLLNRSIRIRSSKFSATRVVFSTASFSQRRMLRAGKPPVPPSHATSVANANCGESKWI
jgi:hypothetical protein